VLELPDWDVYDSEMAEPCDFAFDIFGPCLPIPSVEKKNTNHAAGLSNQGGWAVAGLK
jgi:hypothetical protein